MAHTNCLGTWENSKLGGVLEGNGRFEILAGTSADAIKGTHHGQGGAPIGGKCDGNNIKFCAVNQDTGEVICYKGKITQGTGKLFINGKFKKPLDDGETVVVTDSVVILEGIRMLVAPDDWTAEKPT